MKRGALLGVLVGGCMVPPTSMGVRSSGDLLREGQPVEAGAYGAYGALRESEDEVVSMGPVGVDLGVCLPDSGLNLAMSVSRTTVLSDTVDRGHRETLLPFFQGQGELRIPLSTGKLFGLDATQAVFLGGGATELQIERQYSFEDTPTTTSQTTRGVHLAYVLGLPAGDHLRVYGAYKINPVFQSGSLEDLWLSVSAGVHTASKHRLRLGLEGVGMVGEEGMGGFGQLYVHSRFGKDVGR